MQSQYHQVESKVNINLITTTTTTTKNSGKDTKHICGTKMNSSSCSNFISICTFIWYSLCVCAVSLVLSFSRSFLWEGQTWKMKLNCIIRFSINIWHRCHLTLKWVVCQSIYLLWCSSSSMNNFALKVPKTI